MVTIFTPVLRLDPGLTIGELESQLAELLRAEAVRFVDAEDCGRDVRSDARLSTLAGRPLELRATFPGGLLADPPVGPVNAGPAAPGNGKSSVDVQVERFVRELDALEQKAPGAFVWIGYVLKEKLPAMGLSADDARAFLERLQEQGIVVTSKVPNKRNPDFPATRVQLNRDHSIVQQVVRGRRTTRFQPIKIRGGSISDDIIRDRG